MARWNGSEDGAIMTRDAVLKPDTAVYRYLYVLGAGSVVTIFTTDPAHKSWTDRVAVLTKEGGTWAGWRPKPGEVRIEITSSDDGTISSNTIADLLMGNPYLWASVNEK